jgi:flap endonuclease-1
LVDGDLATAKSKASQTSRMTEGILSQSKALLAALGIPVVQAPSEGEAQAAAMVCADQAFAVGSQDFDSLLFGAPLLIRNLTSSEKRKLPGKQAFVKVHAEVIRLEDGLQALGITRPQLVDMAILMGTDFNEGVKGLGPKKSLAAIKEAGSLEGVLASRPDVAIPLEDIHLLRNLFLSPDVTNVPALRWSLPDRAAVLRLLCDEHQFSEERVKPALEKFEKAEYLRSQKSLFEF